MNGYDLDLLPRDLLFFRDARPMAGGSAGGGDHWPLPQTFHGALLTSLYETWPERQPWEAEIERGRRNGREIHTDLRFGGLRTVGPFPAIRDQVYFPCPKDLVVDTATGQAKVGFQPVGLPASWSSDLPKTLCYPVARIAPPSKDKPPEWISLAEVQRYLDDKPCALTSATELMETESSIGIALSDETGSTREGQLYQARKLRLRGEVSLRAWASAAATGSADVDVLALWQREGRSLIFGGESTSVRVGAQRAKERHSLDTFLPQVGGCRVKWTLFTPALFLAGWRPAWVDENGAVQLRAERPARETGESRAAWRKRIQEAPAIQARLVAALVPSPRHVSGWQLGGKPGPKKTERLVEAGSVYYFETSGPADAKALVRALHGQPRSDSLGEKGYGIGLCSAWTLANLEQGGTA
jgi:CRISPR type III-B/RAMP module-associated protein Cmr3